MALDMYSPCPCGSGKKVKFCCSAIISEMIKVEELIESEQLTAATTLISSLLAKHPNNTWVVDTNLQLQFGGTDPDHALEVGADYFDRGIKTPLSVFGKIGKWLSEDDWQANLSRIQDEFPILVRRIRQLFGVWNMIGEHYQQIGKYPSQILYESAPSYFFDSAEIEDPIAANKDLAVLLGQTDRLLAHRLPLTLRISGPGFDDSATVKFVQELFDLVTHCRFNALADKFQQLLILKPHPDLYFNLGVALIGAGNYPAAQEAFEQSASMEKDPARAIEAEHAALLIRASTPEGSQERPIWIIEINSSALLISSLEQNPNVWDSSGDGEYLLLDRPREALFWKAGKEEQEYPRILAYLKVWPGGEHSSPHIVISSTYYSHKEKLEEFVKSLEEHTIKSNRLVSLGFGPDYQFVATFPMLKDRSVSIEEYKRLKRAAWNHIVNDLWLKSPKQSLRGKTPLEASTDPSLKNRLAAMILLLEDHFETVSVYQDVGELFERLHLTPPQYSLRETSEDLFLSSYQLKTLNHSNVNDEQLALILDLSSKVRNLPLQYRGFTELHSRSKTPLERANICRQIAQCCTRLSLKDEALAWIMQGRREPVEQSGSIHHRVHWDMEEFFLLLEEPLDPKFAQAFDKLWSNYARKLPEIRQFLTNVAASTQEQYPAIKLNMTQIIHTGQETSPGGIWTSDQPTPGETATAGKLWIPGG